MHEWLKVLKLGPFSSPLFCPGNKATDYKSVVSTSTKIHLFVKLHGITGLLLNTLVEQTVFILRLSQVFEDFMLNTQAFSTSVLETRKKNN